MKREEWHISPVYPWFCGIEQFNHLSTTNESQVTCPECLARKPIEIKSDHPLFPFFQEVIKEYARGKGKYGNWSEHDKQWQTDAVKSEVYEWKSANLKTVGGEQRESEELVHLANVSGKRWIEIQRGMKEHEQK